MAQRQFARKPRKTAERNLRLVPPPKRRRRPKHRFRWNIKALKARFPPELLRYEEDIVYAAVEELGHVTVTMLMERYPGRFNEKALWWTLLRLADGDRLLTSRGLGLIGKARMGSIWLGTKQPWFQRYTPVQHNREFWTKASKTHGRTP